MDNVQDSNVKNVWMPTGYHEPFKLSEYKQLILQTAKELEPGFELDEHFKELLNAFCLYFWQDPAFEEKGYGSLQKGLFVTGNVGVGKTLLMKTFRCTPRRLLRLVSTNRVADIYQEHGIERLLNEYCDQSRSNYYAHMCFDDFGAERTSVKHMGNDLNPMERIILARYEWNMHYFTHFTSNLDANQIETLYGTRVRSRLREMVNFFELGGSDRRK